MLANLIRPGFIRILSLFAVLFICNNIYAQPAIFNFTPKSGPVGTVITISGNAFSTTPANNIVRIGGMRANVSAATVSTLTVTVPAGATFDPITVAVNNQIATSNLSFNITYPGGLFSQGMLRYETSVDFTQEIAPTTIASADLDGDGKNDMVMVEKESNDMTVSRNVSTATDILFDPVTHLGAGVKPSGIALGDIDGDGKIDMAIINETDKVVRVVRNLSSPGSFVFNFVGDFPLGSQPVSVAIRDLDGDGKADLVVGVANLFAPPVVVLRNTSVGSTISFAPKIDLAVAGTAVDIEAKDIDSDGKPDIIYLDGLVNIVSVIRNNSTPGALSFATKLDIPTSTFPTRLAVSDIDGDGKNDLVVSNLGGDIMSIYRNTSLGPTISFDRTDKNLDGPDGVVVNDFDGDGRPDIAVIGNTGIFVYPNLSPAGGGSVTLGVLQNFAGSLSDDLLAVDFNNDGAAELVADGAIGFRAMIYRNAATAPYISSFTPTSAAPGATVTITGVNFTGATAVSFGGVAAASFTVVNSTSITAVVAAGISGNVKVTTPKGSHEKEGFIFAGPPVITTFTPTAAAFGETVSINGTNFSEVTAVSFGGIPSPNFFIESPILITAVVGEGASGSVAVTNQYGTATKAGFISKPRILSFTPTTAATGTTVTVTGTSLQNITTVTFGGISASAFTVVNASTITAVVGSGATGDVVVTGSNGTNSLAGFTYIPQPTISSFTPTSGGGLTTVTITGTNFNDVMSVSFGGVQAATYNVISSTSITAVPAAGASGNVSVTTTGGTATRAGFTFIQVPTLTSFSPMTTGTGVTVTISGTDLSTANAVSFGGTPAASFTIVNSTTITAVVGAGGTGVVRVTTPGGIAEASSFTYTTLPVINSYSPASGPVGTTVTIKGANFSPVIANNVVRFGAVRATITAATAFTLTVTVPPGTTYQPIQVISNGLSANSQLPFVITFPGGGPFNANTFAGRMDIPTGRVPYAMVSADIDGDGKADIAEVNNLDDNISIIRNLSTATSLAFAPKVDIACDAHPYAIYSGDIDNDGKVDLAVTSTEGGGFKGKLYRNTSTPGNISFMSPVNFNTNHSATCLYIGDINGDGKADLAMTNALTYLPQPFPGTYFMTVHLNTSTPGNFQLTQQPELPLAPREGENSWPISLSAGDLNRDHITDLVIGYSNSNFFTILKGEFLGSLTFRNIKVLHGGFAYSSQISIADFDNDGQPDVISENSVFRNNGNFSFTEIPMPTGNLPGALADLNGNGKVDLARANTEENNLTVRGNNTTGSSISFEAGINYLTGKSPLDISLGDLDGDGKPEIATINRDDNRISILKNAIGYTGPIITSFSPEGAIAGSTITITGANLSGATAVSFGGVAATSFIVNSSTSITAVVGAGASGNVSVTTAAGTISRAWFTLIPPPPTISSFTPTATGSGNTVTITGTNFSEVTAVTFGGTAAASFLVVSPTTITAIVNTGTTGEVAVTTAGGSAQMAGFIFVEPPTIVSFTPGFGSVGNVITITGTNLDRTTSVTFGGIAAASFVIVSPTSITAVLGSGASGAVRIITPGGSAGKDGFIFVPNSSPYITSFNPGVGATGSTITITGINFSNATSVKFGGVNAASFVINSATSITAVIGTGGSGDVSVTTANGTGTLAGFLYTAAPFITSISPTFSPIGTAVKITGYNFSPTVANNTVYFGPVKTFIASATATQLVVAVPLGAMYAPVTVTCNGMTSYSRQYFQLAFTSVTGLTSTSFASKIDFETGVNPGIISIADMDVDGKADLAIANTANTIDGFLTVYRNTSTAGAVTLAPKINVPNGKDPIEVVHADLNNDGKLDMITSVGVDGFGVSVYQNTSTANTVSYGPEIPLIGNLGPFLLSVGDLNADGKTDLIVTSPVANWVVIYPNTSTGGAISFAARVNVIAGPNPSRAVVGDIDLDGRADIIVTGGTQGNAVLGVLRNTSSGSGFSFDPKVDFIYPNFSRALSLGDLDGDGKLDVITTNEFGNSISIFRNSSTPGIVNFEAKIDIVTPASPYSVAINDLDGDGKPDLVTANGPSNNVSVFPNTSASGTISFGNRMEFATGQFPSHVMIVDVDGDVKPDLVVSNLNDNTISILRNLQDVITAVNPPMAGNVEELKIYPNPAKRFVVVEHKSVSINAEIRVLNITGQVILVQPVGRNSKQTTLDLLGVLPGSYLVVWSDGKTVGGGKFQVLP